MRKQKKIQIVLISLGIFLFLLTYFFYPNFTRKELSEDQIVKENSGVTDKKSETTSFEKLEYKGMYDFDKPFTVKSSKAFIHNNQPDIVHMSNMHVILYLADNRVVNIKSDKGRYNKATYDCYFEENVKATDGETKIMANNLDLLSTEKTISVYSNVSLDYSNGYLEADKILYDFETKYFKVSMFDEKKIKMKLIR